MATTGERSAAAERPGTGPETDRLSAFYRSMLRIREADEIAGGLARRGRLGLLPTATGLEALLAGAAAALRPSDWVLPGPRQSAIALLRGLSPVAWFAQLLGRIADPARGRQAPGHPAVRSLNVFSVSTPPGSQLPQAAGVARAMRRAGRDEVALALCGHAASSTADFHVGLNFAAVWRVPAVFLVDRGDGLAEQTAAESVAIKAEGYGMPGHVIDGADPAEVQAALEEAMARARAGEGPTLLDARVPSPPLAFPALSGPRPIGGAPRSDWELGDPLARAERGLRAGALGAAALEELRSTASAELAAAAELAEALPPPPLELLFQDVLAHRSASLDRQLEEAREHAAREHAARQPARSETRLR